MRSAMMTAALTVVASLAVSAVAGARASAAATVEMPDGKVLLKVFDKQVEDAGGKVLVYISGNDLLLDPAAPPTLVVDDRTVRPSAAGVIVAHFEGEDVRHGNATESKVLMNYHHPDLCPTAQANRLYCVNGDPLTKQQLVAVLYALKPELLKLSDAEVADQKKAIAEAGAESDRLAAADHVAKKWRVLNGHGPAEKIGQGSITFMDAKDMIYPAVLDYTAAGGPSWTGVAAAKDVSGDKYVFTAFGTPKSIGLCVYTIGDGGKLSGVWHPWYDRGEAKNLGTEELTGPATLDGDYQITSAKAPTTGAAYGGTVTIKPLEIVGADDEEKPYEVTWTIGGTKIQGIGIKTGKQLYVASGGGADVLIGKFKIGNGSFNGDFFKLGSKEMGGLAATD